MDIVTYTNIGGRTNNEDYCDYYSDDDKACLVVCDGLGGHENGEVASKAVVEIIIESFKQKPIVSKENMAELLQRAQDHVIGLQEKNVALSEMKTTVTCVMVLRDYVITGHIGDSRIYILRKNKILFESEDHSVPYALYKSKRIKKKEIRTHEDGNVVLRSIGSVWDTPKYDISLVEKLKSGDGILLCTDGFWENILEKDMMTALKQCGKSKCWMDKMVNVVKTNISKEDHDNYTAITLIL